MRYYISHRLVALSGEAHRDAWRLPAPELVDKVAGLVRRIINAPGFAAMLLPNATADRIAQVAEKLSNVAGKESARLTLELIARIDIAPDKIELHLDAHAIVEAINADAAALATNALTASFPFQLRKRGVETKIILADSPARTDETLIRNIAQAHAWFERIKVGDTFAQIAKTEATSKRRIQQMIALAFLAPDTVRDVLNGNQPIGFTSDWCKNHELPGNWSEQRRILATL